MLPLRCNYLGDIGSRVFEKLCMEHTEVKRMRRMARCKSGVWLNINEQQKKSRVSRRFKSICGGISRIFFSRVRNLNSTVHSRQDYGCGLLFRFLTKISVPRALCSFFWSPSILPDELVAGYFRHFWHNEFKLCNSGLPWSAVIKRATFCNYLHNV